MTNLIALCLLLSTLLTAEVWSPNPATTHRTEEDIIVKDGHRVVVVEYDRDGKTKTRVSISPPTADKGEKSEEKKTKNGAFRNAKETASYLPNVGQGISQPETSEEREEETEEARGHHVTPGELICDAFGKCRRKIANVVGRAKDRTADTVDDIEETTYDAGDAAARKAYDVKETVTRAARDVVHKARDAKEKVTEKAYDVKEMSKDKVKEKAEHVRDVAAHKAQDLKETAAQKSHNVWDIVKAATRELRSGVAAALSPSKIGSVVGLIATAAAYGTSVWVTFVSSYVLASVLGKQQFGLVQSKVYPVYFKAISVGILMGLIGHVLSRGRKLLTDGTEMWQGVNLIASFFMVEANKSFVEPRATKAMFERMKAEKEEGRGREASDAQLGVTAAAAERTTELEMRRRLEKLSARLSKLNTYSSWLNILTLMSLTWHFVYLGQRLGSDC